MYNALIETHFLYCCTVWDGMADYLANKFQNCAGRVITGCSYNTSSSLVLDTLGENKLSTKSQKAQVDSNKSLTNLTPKYLKTQFKFRENVYEFKNVKNKTCYATTKN